MYFEYFVANAFIDPNIKFSGNPAALIILDSDADIDDKQKQLIGRQLNLSETVFLSKETSNDKKDKFLIRWFTSMVEVELCGHATIVTAYLLHTQKHQYREKISSNEPIIFRTKWNVQVEASFDGERSITLKFPLHTPSAIDSAQNNWLDRIKTALIGETNQKNVRDTTMIVDAQLSPIGYLLIRLRDDIDLATIEPDFEQMRQIDSGAAGVYLVMITQQADFERTGAHIYARVFAPWVNTNEDPVCGSAFTVMGPYWSRVLNRSRLIAKQKSKHGGIVRMQILDDHILIQGEVQLFSKGQIYLP